MKKILNIITSPRGNASYSNKLGDAIIAKITGMYPTSIVVTRDLTRFSLPHLDAAQLDAFVTAPGDHSAAQRSAAQLSDELIKEIFSVDIIVLNVAMWNFSISSSLKAWIDQIARAGITFGFSENGPVGLFENKKVFLAMASGGVYSEVPYSAMDFAVPYLRFMLGFLGITDVTILRVEGLANRSLQANAFDKAIEAVNEIKLTSDRLVSNQSF